jgi:hypothetical protein
LRLGSIEAICGIPAAVRREDVSLRDAIKTSGFRNVRGQLTEGELAAYLAEQPEVARAWWAFSEDKRTKGGWALVERGSRWALSEPFPSSGSPGTSREFDDLAEACAAYILAELDFWVAVEDRRTEHAE